MLAKSLALNVRYFSAVPLRGLLTRFGTLPQCTKPLEKSVQSPHAEKRDIDFLELMKVHGEPDMAHFVQTPIYCEDIKRNFPEIRNAIFSWFNRSPNDLSIQNITITM